jgi:DNA mismatch repair protein MutL
MLPVALEIPLAEREAFELILPLLGEMGIEVEAVDETQYVVKGLPSDFDNIDVQALVRDVLDRADDGSDGRADGGGIEALRDLVMARMACHGAIRSGQRLSREEMEALVSGMVERQLSFTCPHGRPTMVLLSRDQLDRQFGRMG